MQKNYLTIINMFIVLERNMSNELIVYFFANTMDKFIIKKPCRLQDSSPTHDSSLIKFIFLFNPLDKNPRTAPD